MISQRKGESNPAVIPDQGIFLLLLLLYKPTYQLYLQFSVLNPQLFILLSQRRVRLYPYIRSLSPQSISFALLLYCNSVIAWYCHKLAQSGTLKWPNKFAIILLIALEEYDSSITEPSPQSKQWRERDLNPHGHNVSACLVTHFTIQAFIRFQDRAIYLRVVVNPAYLKMITFKILQ